MTALDPAAALAAPVMLDEESVMREAQALGMSEQQQMDDMFSIGAPRGNFSATALNAVVRSFNDVLASMGIPEPYPEFGEGARVLPGEFVRGLAMVADAAEQAGMPATIELDGVTDDTDLEMLAGKLSALADNPTFIEAMAQPVGPPESPPQPGMGEEIPPESTEPAASDLDDLFAERA